MEYFAAFVIYGIIMYILIKLINSYSNKKIHKDVFELEYQIFFFIGAFFLFLYVNIDKHTIFAETIKYIIFILLVIDILIYFIVKFKSYSFGWAILSIVLDILVFPLLLLIVLGLIAAYSDCCNRYYYRNDNCDY